MSGGTWMIICLFVAGVGGAASASAQLPQSQSQARDEDQHWRMPLEQKAQAIQRNIDAVHDMEGTYVPTVTMPPDLTTTGDNGDMHTVSWTGCYLLAAGFRLGWAREHGTPADLEAALNHGGRILGGVQLLSHISGIPGLLTRYVVRGHGVGPEERGYGNERNWWFQGKPPYQDFRYRSHPSHHNYHHMMRGLAIYYYFLTKDNPNPPLRFRAQIDSVKALVTDIMNWGYKQNNMVLMREDGTPSLQQIMSGIPEGRPSTKGIMATDSLRWGYWITGDRWYKQKYDEYVQRYNYRGAGNIPPDQWQGGATGLHAPDFDDTEHILASLWVTEQIEDDAQLKDFYKMAIRSIFASKRTDKRSPFNYFYAAGTGNTEDADLPGALETMRLFPSDWTIYPLMNSIRSDITTTRDGEGGRGVSGKLLPFNEQPYDNAFTWKNDPYDRDRFVSRSITAMAVSGEDPYVRFIADGSGALYFSRDAGQTFEVHEKPEGAIRSVTFAANKNRVAVAATSTGIYWTQEGGYGNSWHHVTVGSDAGAVKVMLDPDNPNVVWAVMRDGVYRSEDLGVEEVGKAWTKVSRPFPEASTVLYGVRPGNNALIYATSGGKMYHHAVGAANWSVAPRSAEEYHILPVFTDLIASPSDPNTAFFLLNLNVWGRDLKTVLRTVDGGQTVKITGTATWQRLGYLPTEGSGIEGASVAGIAFDAQNHQVIYAASDKGVLRSADGGVTWQASNTGLRIPYAFGVFTSKQAPGKVYVSTPAGLHVSTDAGLTWSAPHLVLNGPGVRRTDRGGMCYLVGYWPGRYFGYITDAQANASPDAWSK